MTSIESRRASRRQVLKGAGAMAAAGLIGAPGDQQGADRRHQDRRADRAVGPGRHPRPDQRRRPEGRVRQVQRGGRHQRPQDRDGRPRLQGRAAGSRQGDARPHQQRQVRDHPRCRGVERRLRGAGGDPRSGRVLHPLQFRDLVADGRSQAACADGVPHGPPGHPRRDRRRRLRREDRQGQGPEEVGDVLAGLCLWPLEHGRVHGICQAFRRQHPGRRGVVAQAVPAGLHRGRDQAAQRQGRCDVFGAVGRRSRGLHRPGQPLRPVRQAGVVHGEPRRLRRASTR